MSIFSVEEDFSRNTLAAVPTLWGRLHYVSSLLQQDGRYEHWGLARKFGQEAAERAIRSAHRELMFEVLRTPIRELVSETKKAAGHFGFSEKEFVEMLAARVDSLMPQEIVGGPARHFRTVLTGISFLVQDCTGANRQAS